MRQLAILWIAEETVADQSAIRTKDLKTRITWATKLCRLNSYELPCCTGKPESIEVAYRVNPAIYHISIPDNHVCRFRCARYTFDHGFARGGEKQHDSQKIA
ncbi:MAG: hypothetical protein ACREA0_03215 [bacterium]